MNIDPAYENFLFYAFSDGWVSRASSFSMLENSLGNR